MATVRVLPSDLANQIAAGEVVERPASVVKELVENALDAGATRVKVAIEQGGVTRVTVTDDGEGMTEADARLALQRHATSKIERVEDLSAIGTFGFRGEALPSMASVAKLTLTTRARGADEARDLVIEGGGPPDVRPSGAAVGTTVDVRELFFNVPARRKFLKSTATESAHVGEVVMLAALARPDVTFELSRDGKVAREYLRVATRAERAAQVMSEERLEACEGTRGPFHVEAHLGAPERSRAGAVALHVFVNGRPVKDRALSRAVAQAYGSVLEPGRYPVGVVYIDLPREMVDVNVHPQKAEVRFADARALYDALTRELHARLARAYAVPALGPVARPWMPPQRGPIGGIADTMPPTPYAPDPWGLTPMMPAVAMNANAPGATPALFTERGFYGRLRFLAQTRATFLVCEGDDGVYVIDQHAAAERVTFDALRRAMGTRAVATQRLLIPDIVELSPAEVAALDGHASEMEAMGLDVRPVSASSVAVHSVPKLLAGGRARPERLVRDLVSELSRASGRAFGAAADRALATMACHASIRAGDAVTREEAEALLRALDDVDFSGHCPHGRPVLTRLGFEDLERRVGR